MFVCRKVEPRAVFELMANEQVTMLCAAPTVLISLANAPEDLRRLAPKEFEFLPLVRRLRLPPSRDSKKSWVGRLRTYMA